MTASNPRLGYCCMFVSPSGDKAETKRMNVTSTTISALSRMERSAALEKVIGIVRHNIKALEAQFAYIGALPPLERLFRMSSDLLPAYTHEVGAWMYREPVMRRLLEDGFGDLGKLARRNAIRLSMHPGQYCVLAAVSDQTQANAVAEFEYHIDIMRWLGLTGGWHKEGAHVNIHVGSTAGGLERFRIGLSMLSDDARGLITVENDENMFGLDDVLKLADALPIVLDFHHHWVHSRGEYLTLDDQRLAAIRGSWRGTRPLSHISVSKESLLHDHPTNKRPDFLTLNEAGFTPNMLRAHSDMMWNDAVNDWMASHLAWTDLEVEAKSKNLASRQLAARATAAINH